VIASIPKTAAIAAIPFFKAFPFDVQAASAKSEEQLGLGSGRCSRRNS
jgi:hypothetical protein